MRAIALIVACMLGGCLLKPNRVDVAPDDARIDGSGSGSGLSVRVVKNAWFVAGFSMSPGMTQMGYSIQTTGIHAGDLVILIMNVDNGSDAVMNPVDNDFTPLREHFFGSDGQTYAVFWKIASSSEPAAYAGSWGAGIYSAAATITLLAVTGYNQGNPIDGFRADDGDMTGMAPVKATSMGVTTKAAGSLLIYAGGADWLGQDSSATFSVPTGFTKLVAFGDKGETTGDFQWTTLLIASSIAGPAGPTGTIEGGMQSSTSISGIPWAVTIAVAPAP